MKRSIKTKERLKMEKELKISADDALKAYKNADNYGKSILEELFGKEFYKIDVKERVKCLEGAVTLLGMDNQTVKDYYSIARKTSAKDIVAFAKLRVIAEALNEGWKKKIGHNKFNYYPWFYTYTKKEYEILNEDEKKECKIVRKSCSFKIEHDDIVYVRPTFTSTDLYTWCGSRLALKSKELAEFCCKQFFDIWKDYLFG